MDCKHIQDLLPLYLINETEDEITSGIEKHLAECKECKNALNELEVLNNTISEIALPPVPSEITNSWKNIVEKQDNLEISKIKKSTKIVYGLVALGLFSAFIFGLFNFSSSINSFKSEASNQNKIADNSLVLEQNRPLIIRLTAKGDERQILNFKIQLKGGIRFLGKNLQTEKSMLMSWKEEIDIKGKEILIPFKADKNGKASINISVKNRNQQFKKTLNINIIPQKTAAAAPKVTTLIF